MGLFIIYGQVPLPISAEVGIANPKLAQGSDEALNIHSCLRLKWWISPEYHASLCIDCTTRIITGNDITCITIWVVCGIIYFNLKRKQVCVYNCDYKKLHLGLTALK